MSDLYTRVREALTNAAAISVNATLSTASGSEGAQEAEASATPPV